MLAPIPVVLVEYNREWPTSAAQYGERLLQSGAGFISVHHIGSTSIPGIVAKPIIDLMPVVSDEVALDRGRSAVEELGYVWHGACGIEGRRYCTLTDAAGARIAQLHIFAEASSHVRRHLAFRDYLRTHADVAMAYETEKRRAKALHPDNSHSYSDEKSIWIREIEHKALVWLMAMQMQIRDAIPGDAEQACDVMRRSIIELCVPDHRNDPAILNRWLANKKLEINAAWIAQPDASMLLAIEGDAVLAVGGVTDAGEITLNYVSPDARFQGVTKALLAALEARAKERGNRSCALLSIQTAYRFYLAAGYADDGAPINKVGSPGQPMAKEL